MKAVVYTEYGAPDVMRVVEAEKPVPKDNEVLIRIHAASVNPLDMHMMHGPLVVRIAAGLRSPKDPRIGVDVAGRVEAAGRNVTEFQAGDDVFGPCTGAFAEYVCAPAADVIRKPQAMSYEEAAAIPVAGLTAFQALRKGQVRAGSKILIIGAGGGVGSFAVQIAKSLGAHVTAVCGSHNVEGVRALGADRVVDYTREDFSKNGERYDVIFDCVGKHSLRACRRALKADGAYLMIGAYSTRAFAFLPRLLGLMFLAMFGKRKMSMFMAQLNKDDLKAMCELIESGKVRPVIDRRYRLDDAADAMRYLETKHARGKVVITVPQERS
jgi:2-desacetyl-2-hydroxyethyl bacteriochlorophyllide A dehydrogenase